MAISKENQERLDYETKVWDKINEEKDSFNSKQEYYHFRLYVLDELTKGNILCSCGQKATVFGLHLFMCPKCDKEMGDSMMLAHSDHDPNDESMSWNYS